MIITITILVLISLGFILYKNGTFTKLNFNNQKDSSVVVRDFINMMIPHHNEAVKVSLSIMNDLSITEPKVRILAANIVDTQSFEIAKMKTIYSDYLGGEYTSSTSTESHIMGDYKDIKGDDLAKTYIKDMIKHHKEAIKAAEKYIKLIDKINKQNSKTENGLTITNSHPALDTTYEIAKGIIDSQNKEIELMESLY